MESQSTKSSNWVMYAAVAVVVICVCVAVALVTGVAAYLFVADSRNARWSPFTGATVEAPASSVVRPPTRLPQRDLRNVVGDHCSGERSYDLGLPLVAVCSSPTVPAPRALPSRRWPKFWIANSDTIEHFEIDAMRCITSPIPTSGLRRRRGRRRRGRPDDRL
jgi:hypothetical protein